MNYVKLFVIGFTRSLGGIAIFLIWAVGMLWPAAFCAPGSPFMPLAVVWATAWLGATIYVGMMAE